MFLYYPVRQKTGAEVDFADLCLVDVLRVHGCAYSIIVKFFAQVYVTFVISRYAGEEAKKNTLRNQFNFSERASQTYNEVQRTRTIATQPPLCKSFADTVTQWTIYDSYLKDIEAAENAKNTQGKSKAKEFDFEPKKKTSESDPIYSDAMKLSIKLMERMVNQNAEAEIYHDFQYGFC